MYFQRASLISTGEGGWVGENQFNKHEIVGNFQHVVVFSCWGLELMPVLH